MLTSTSTIDYKRLLRERAAEAREREPEAPLSYLDERNRECLREWREKCAALAAKAGQ